MRKDFESNYNTGEGTGRRMKMIDEPNRGLWNKK